MKNDDTREKGACTRFLDGINDFFEIIAIFYFKHIPLGRGESQFRVFIHADARGIVQGAFVSVINQNKLIKAKFSC